MKRKKQKWDIESNPILVWNNSSRLAGFGIAPDHAGIRRCLNFVAHKFCEPITVRDLVKISGLSRRGFCKAFTKNVGTNPSSLLRHVRIEYAKRLLVENDLKLKQVARRCGYRLENTFCVAFSRTVGVSPKRFQSQYWLAISRNHWRDNIHPLVTSQLSPGANGVSPESGLKNIFGKHQFRGRGDDSTRRGLAKSFG